MSESSPTKMKVTNRWFWAKYVQMLIQTIELSLNGSSLIIGFHVDTNLRSP